MRSAVLRLKVAKIDGLTTRGERNAGPRLAKPQVGNFEQRISHSLRAKFDGSCRQTVDFGQFSLLFLRCSSRRFFCKAASFRRVPASPREAGLLLGRRRASLHRACSCSQAGARAGRKHPPLCACAALPGAVAPPPPGADASWMGLDAAACFFARLCPGGFPLRA